MNRALSVALIAASAADVVTFGLYVDVHGIVGEQNPLVVTAWAVGGIAAVATTKAVVTLPMLVLLGGSASGRLLRSAAVAAIAVVALGATFNVISLLAW